jgi:hypothetical protein
MTPPIPTEINRRAALHRQMRKAVCLFTTGNAAFEEERDTTNVSLFGLETCEARKKKQNLLWPET